MREFLLGVFVLCRKELLIIKDKRARIILVMPIVLQTILFGHVATYDVTNVSYALLDFDRSKTSRDLVRLFDGSGIFHRVKNLSSSREIAATIDSKDALLVIHIEHGFERALHSGGVAQVQLLLDGRNSNVAGVVLGYAQTLVATYSASLHGSSSALSIESRAWFNPNLETRWGILSALTAVMAVIQVLSIAGQSVAREKEQGTFDQLLVTPLHPAQVLIGKAVPPVLVGLLQSAIVLIVAIWLFHIPFQGSYALFFFALTIYTLSVVGIGLCVSAFAKNMQQAMLYNFTLLMPMILLSGFATPIRSMPYCFQIATMANPVRYGVEFAQRIYLEGAGFEQILPDLIPLSIMALITLPCAAYLFTSDFFS